MTGPTGEPVGAELALKEWGAAVHALLQGRQTVLLRKGGIHEKRFLLEGSEFLLYPTVAHSHADATRPEHADLLPLGAADVADQAVVVRASASVVEAIEVARPENIAALEPFHIWTTASVQANRIDFRPKRRLTAVVVSVRPLVPPVRLPMRDEYSGCRSWVELVEVPGTAQGEPVRPDAELVDVAAQVRYLVGEPTSGRVAGDQGDQ
ncbi:DUF1802 family protein [Nakamurella sp.]|uniref:DUF1802 family protein n=1 Tax=Nakamurella sp. TaxID=1869182 RepID=UPI003784C3A1